jgi:hypothetical protein
MGTAVGPPALRGKQGRPLLNQSPDQQDRQPLLAGHKNRATGRSVVAGFHVGQPCRFTGSCWAQFLQVHAFGLLPTALIPDHQALLSGLLEVESIARSPAATGSPGSESRST